MAHGTACRPLVRRGGSLLQQRLLQQCLLQQWSTCQSLRHMQTACQVGPLAGEGTGGVCKPIYVQIHLPITIPHIQFAPNPPNPLNYHQSPVRKKIKKFYLFAPELPVAGSPGVALVGHWPLGLDEVRNVSERTAAIVQPNDFTFPPRI